MRSPNVAVRRFSAVWAASLAWKVVALAVLLYLAARWTGGTGP